MTPQVCLCVSGCVCTYVVERASVCNMNVSLPDTPMLAVSIFQLSSPFRGEEGVWVFERVAMIRNDAAGKCVCEWVCLYVCV